MYASISLSFIIQLTNRTISNKFNHWSIGSTIKESVWFDCSLDEYWSILSHMNAIGGVQLNIGQLVKRVVIIQSIAEPDAPPKNVLNIIA